MHFSVYILLTILVFINIWKCYQIISQKISIFNPNALFSLTVITQIFPQLIVIFLNDFYPSEIIPQLLVVMILSQLAFIVGFKSSDKVSQREIFRDWDYERLPYLAIIFSIIGLIPMPFYKTLTSVYGGVNVIFSNLRLIGTIGLIISLISLEKSPSRFRKLLIISTALSTLPLLYYGYVVKGSREGIFILVIIFLYFLSRRKPQWNPIISNGFLLLFIIGSVIGASMTEIRRINNYKEDNSKELSGINYFENYKNSVINKDLTHGMDLGNGAILIDYVSQNSTYDFGTSIWNGFIYIYFPGRFLGDNLKDKLMIKIFSDNGTENLEATLCDGITTRTGYYTTFKMFSYLGCFIFFLIAFVLGILRKYSHYSGYYTMLYIYCLTGVPTMLTHSTQYMFSRFELVFIILFPFFITTMIKLKLNYTTWIESQIANLLSK